MAVKDVFDEIRGVIEGIDLQAIQDAFQGVLTTFTSQLEPLTNALTTLRGTVETLIVNLGTSLGEIDLPALIGQLTTALTDVLGLLQSQGVADALGAIQQNLDTMATQLQEIGFAPVIDEVLAQIDEMRQRLSEIDVSSLNDILRMALAAALEVVQALDFQGEVVDPLIAQFDGIAEVPKQLLADAVSSFNVLETRIQTLQPTGLIADALAEPLQVMEDGLASIRPSQALLPVQEQFDAFCPHLI